MAERALHSELFGEAVHHLLEVILGDVFGQDLEILVLGRRKRRDGEKA
jgi:hypothetical protein